MKYIIGHLKPDLDSAVAALALEYLYEKVPCFGKGAKAFLASEPNFETKTIFIKFKTKIPDVLDETKVALNDAFVLIDHNEAIQRHKAVKEEKIVEIVDHHKIVLNLVVPIFITVKPWGSSSTVVFWMMEINKISPDKTLASLMMTAILSDTVGFKSPTTTDKDKEVFERLKKIAGIHDVEALTMEVLKAKSSLTGMSIKQIITKDYKEYEFNGKKVLINQVETADQNSLLKISNDLIEEMKKLKKEVNLTWTVSVITDIFKINSKAIVSPEDENLLIKAFPKAQKIKPGVYDIGPLMSRKKEIVPAIEKVF